MSITLAVRPTIVDRVLPRGLVTDIALIFGAAALTALAAQVSIPTALGVPFTLQTFAVLLAGATLGSVRGALSMIVYALAGVIGLPVFADASHGVDVIFGATGGFIIGFIVAAAAIGLIAESNFGGKVLRYLSAATVGSVVIYLVGIPVLAAVSGVDLITATGWMVPFMIWDVVKAAAAGLALPGAWKLVEKIKN
jgi:biotin transport system substrate-specific component